jgi:Ulp1 family protease
MEEYLKKPTEWYNNDTIRFFIHLYLLEEKVGNYFFHFPENIKINAYRKINLPSQDNACDCGLYTILYACYVIKRQNIPKKQDRKNFGDSFQLRKKITRQCFDIIENMYDFVTYPDKKKKNEFENEIQKTKSYLLNIQKK